MQLFGSEVNWVVLALAGMVSISLANMALKVLVKDFDFTKYDFSGVIPFVAVVTASILLGYLAFFSKTKLESSFVLLFIAFAAFSALAFLSISFALKTGKVALVTAVVSLSTVLVAILSFAFLGDSFSLKEAAAMALAMAAVLLLVF